MTRDEPPEAWVLCVRGESFELGDEVSTAAAHHLEAAWIELRRRIGPGPR